MSGATLSESFQDVHVPSFTFSHEEGDYSLLAAQQQTCASVLAMSTPGEYTFFTDDGRTVRLPPSPARPFSSPPADSFCRVSIQGDQFLFFTDDGRAVRIDISDGVAAAEGPRAMPAPAPPAAGPFLDWATAPLFALGAERPRAALWGDVTPNTLRLRGGSKSARLEHPAAATGLVNPAEVVCGRACRVARRRLPAHA
jgi:hypothetical protein